MEKLQLGANENTLQILEEESGRHVGDSTKGHEGDSAKQSH